MNCFFCLGWVSPLKVSSLSRKIIIQRQGCYRGKTPLASGLERYWRAFSLAEDTHCLKFIFSQSCGKLNNHCWQKTSNEHGVTQNLTLTLYITHMAKAANISRFSFHKDSRFMTSKVHFVTQTQYLELWSVTFSPTWNFAAALRWSKWEWSVIEHASRYNTERHY